jgi:hypothetical protein
VITVRQAIKAEDYRHAVFLHLRPRPVFGIAAGFVPALGLFALGLFALAAMLCSPDRWSLHTFGLLGCLLFIGLHFCVLIPRRATKSFNQNRFLKHDAECRIDESGLHMQSDLLGTSEIPWDHLHKWKESKRMVLLYPTDDFYFIIPRRNFSSDGWEELRSLAARKLKKVP